jgi:hypothetical protein
MRPFALQLQLMSKLMSTAQVFCETRVHFRNQLSKETAASQDATSHNGSSKVSEEVLAYLSKIESSWERRLSVSTRDKTATKQ